MEMKWYGLYYKVGDSEKSLITAMPFCEGNQAAIILDSFSREITLYMSEPIDGGFIVEPISEEELESILDHYHRTDSHGETYGPHIDCR